MLRRSWAWAALAAGLLVLPARAADPAPSLKIVPADAAFYSASLRLKEQLDRFLGSNAYAKLKAMPAAKLAVEQMKKEIAKEGNGLGQFLKMMESPENQELTALLKDAISSEIFMYGAANWGDLPGPASTTRRRAGAAARAPRARA